MLWRKFSSTLASTRWVLVAISHQRRQPKISPDIVMCPLEEKESQPQLRADGLNPWSSACLKWQTASATRRPLSTPVRHMPFA